MPDGNGQPTPPPESPDISEAMFNAIEAAEAILAKAGLDVKVMVMHYLVAGSESDGFDYVAATGKPSDASEISEHHRAMFAHSLGLTIGDMRAGKTQ